MSGFERGAGLPAPGGIDRAQAVRVLRLEGFEPAVPADPVSRDALERRFVTLFDDGAARYRGGLGEVRRVTNIWGEAFALKTLAPAEEEPAGGSGGACEASEGPAEGGACGRGPSSAAGRAAAAEALRREYRLQRRVSGLKGFPRVHGIGALDGEPAILMEWVEGVTLAKAARRLSVDDRGAVSPLAAARIGRDLFELLARLDAVEGGIVHGDVSCGNVMVRTDRLPLEEQVEEGVFDLCLVDFGSARFAEGGSDGDASRATGGTGSATAEYAAPEAIDPRAGAALSPAADVYAAGGVVFRLVTARYPYDLPPGADRAAARRLKERTAPAPFSTAHAADDVAAVLLHEPEVAVAVGLARDDAASGGPEATRLALVQTDALLDPILLACLSPDPARRPQAAEVRDALGAFAFHYAGNIRRALRGEPLTPCVPGGLADGYGAEARARRGALRRSGKALCTGALLLAAAIAGGLASALPAAFPGAAEPLARGAGAGLAAAAVVLLPFALGLIVRGRGGGAAPALVRGGAGLLAGALLSAACLALLGPAGADLGALLACGAASSACAGWCCMALDRACGDARRAPRRKGAPALAAGGKAIDRAVARGLEEGDA